MHLVAKVTKEPMLKNMKVDKRAKAMWDG